MTTDDTPEGMRRVGPAFIDDSITATVGKAFRLHADGTMTIDGEKEDDPKVNGLTCCSWPLSAHYDGSLVPPHTPTTDDTRPLCGHWRVSPPGNQRGWCCEHCGQPFTPSPDPYSFTCRCGVTMDQSDASRHECAPAPDPLREAALAVVEAWDARDYTNRSEHHMAVGDVMHDLRAALASEEKE